MRVGRSNELLELACVIQLQVVADHGVDANALTCLEETRLSGQAGRSCVRVTGLNGGNRVPVCCPDIHEAPIEFSKQGRIQPANSWPFEDGLDDVAADDALSHSEQRCARQSGVIAQ